VVHEPKQGSYGSFMGESTAMIDTPDGDSTSDKHGAESSAPEDAHAHNSIRDSAEESQESSPLVDPSPENLEDLLKNQSADIEVLSQLFKEQHLEHVRQLENEEVDDLTRQVNDRLLIRLANQNQVDESLTELREQIALLEQQEIGDKDGGHSGSWRCSVMSCSLEQSDHDYSLPFEDGKRHIFFWDCCLSDDRMSQKCDLDFFDFDD
jgi:hypothetical protein